MMTHDAAIKESLTSLSGVGIARTSCNCQGNFYIPVNCASHGIVFVVTTWFPLAIQHIFQTVEDVIYIVSIIIDFYDVLVLRVDLCCPQAPKGDAQRLQQQGKACKMDCGVGVAE